MYLYAYNAALCWIHQSPLFALAWRMAIFWEVTPCCVEYTIRSTLNSYGKSLKSYCEVEALGSALADVVLNLSCRLFVYDIQTVWETDSVKESNERPQCRFLNVLVPNIKSIKIVNKWRQTGSTLKYKGNRIQTWSAHWRETGWNRFLSSILFFEILQTAGTGDRISKT